MDVQKYHLPIAYFPRMNYAYKNSSDIYNRYRRLTADFVEKEFAIIECEEVVLQFCKKKTECQFPAEINEVVRPKNELSADNIPYPNVRSILNEQPKETGSMFVKVFDIIFLDETAELSSRPGLFVFIANSLAQSEGNLPDNCIVTTKDRVGSDIRNRLEKIVLKPMNEICAFLQRMRKPLNCFPLGSRKYNDLRNVPITKPPAVTQQENFQDKSHLTDLDVNYQSFGSSHSETNTMVTLVSRNYYDSRNVPIMKPSATTQNENGSDKLHLTDSDNIYQGFRSNHEQTHAMVTLGSMSNNYSRHYRKTKPSANKQDKNNSDNTHLPDSDAIYQGFRSNHGETHVMVTLGSRKCNGSKNVPITKPSVIPQNENGSDKSHLTDSDTVYQGFRSNYDEPQAMVTLGSRECNYSRNVPITKPSAIPQNENGSDKSHLNDLDAIDQGFRSNHSETHAMVTDTATCSPLFKKEIPYKRKRLATEGQMEKSDTKKQKFMKKIQ